MDDDSDVAEIMRIAESIKRLAQARMVEDLKSLWETKEFLEQHKSCVTEGFDVDAEIKFLTNQIDLAGFLE